jgi:two-component SAPR family response regulator
MKVTLARLLIGDHGEGMRTFVMNSLRRICSQTIEVAADVASAFRAMISFGPGWVLANIHMWPLDDIEFVRQMRKHANSRVKK